MTHRRPPWLTTVRWITVLPASFVAAWLAHFLVVLGNRLTMTRFVDPDSFSARGLIAFLSHVALGVVTIYVACFVAPSHRRMVAAIMTAMSLVLIGAAVGLAVPKRDFWAIFGGVCAAVGACVTAYSVHSREIRFREDTVQGPSQDTRMRLDAEELTAPHTPAANVMCFAKRVAFFLLGFAVLGVFLFIGSESIRTIPDNAIVYVDEETKTYFSPPLLRTDSRDFCMPVRYSYVRRRHIEAASSEVEAMIEVVPPDPDDIVYIDLKREVFAALPIKGARIVVPMTMGEIDGEEGFAPDWEHRDKGGFRDKRRGWFGCAIEKLNLREPRWTESGEWNW